jgi:2-keto-4-pentenoate hydratase/2-oxohepta-3-ene-1,7-dioic acid hydratase in catechol pathway
MFDTSKSKIVCIGRNYIEHIDELQNEIPTNPVIFIKPNSAISSSINLHSNIETHYETEMVFRFDSNNNVDGVAIGLDLTDRNLQSDLKSKGLPWELAKSFDGSAVIGEFVKTDCNNIDKLSFKSYKNNTLVQSGNYNQMIYKPNFILDFLKKNNISFLDNDLLMSGTPKGVGIINNGDTFRVELFCENELILETIFK